MPIISDAPVRQRMYDFATILFLASFSFILFRVWYAVLEKIYNKIVPKRFENSVWPQFLWALALSLVFFAVSVMLGVLPF